MAVTIDYHSSGKGIAFGKVAEAAELLDIAWPVKLHDTPAGTGNMLALTGAGVIGDSGKKGGRLRRSNTRTRGRGYNNGGACYCERRHRRDNGTRRAYRAWWTVLASHAVRNDGASADINTIIDPSFSCYSNNTNASGLFAVIGGNLAYVNQHASGNTMNSGRTRVQIAMSDTTNKMAIRRYNGGWSDWAEIQTGTVAITAGGTGAKQTQQTRLAALGVRKAKFSITTTTSTGYYTDYSLTGIKTTSTVISREATTGGKQTGLIAVRLSHAANA